MSSPFAGFVWTLSYSPELEDMLFSYSPELEDRPARSPSSCKARFRSLSRSRCRSQRGRGRTGGRCSLQGSGCGPLTSGSSRGAEPFLRKDRRLCCEYLLDYFCRLKTDFIRIHRTWGVCVDSLGSARYQDIFRIRLSLKFRIN